MTTSTDHLSGTVTGQSDLEALLPPKRRAATLPGRLKYLALYEPRVWLRQGIRYKLAGKLAERQLVRAIRSGRLVSPYVVGNSSLAPVCYLIGRKYVPLGILSAYSLRLNVDPACEVIFHDDGSLSPEDIALLKFAIPNCQVIERPAWEPHPDDGMKLKILSLLQSRYPHLNKILFQFNRNEYNIVSDCDVLYMDSCRILQDYSSSRRPFYIVDKAEFYGVSRANLTQMNFDPPSRLNAGLYAVSPAKIDWQELDRWCLNVLERHGFSYVLEQLLTALIVGKQDGSPLPPTYAMAAYENQHCGPPNVLHYANTVPAMYIDAAKMIREHAALTFTGR